MNFKLNVTQINCKRVAPLLFARSVNAPLGPRDAARLQAHLNSCPACRTEAAELADVGKLLRANAPAAPLPAPDLWSRIEAEIAPQNQNAPRRTVFPAMNGMAWAGSCAIVLVWGGWMTVGSGLWTRLHHSAQSGAGLVQVSRAPATITLFPSPFAPGTASASAPANRAVSPPQAPSAFADATAGIVAARAAAAKNEARKAAPALLPRVDPFVASEHHGPHAPMGLVMVSHAAPKPAPVGPSAVRVVSVGPPSHGVAPASDTVAAVAEVTPFAAASPGEETPASVAETTASAGATKTVTAASVYATPGVTAASPLATVAAASFLDETTRSPLPSGANGVRSDAFSVADAAAKAQRQRALFSYSRP